MVLPFLLIVLLVGCSRINPPETPISTCFKCDAEIQYKDMSIKGHITRVSAGTLKVELTEPASLNGMSMEWDGETISVELYGMTFNVDPSTIPTSGLGESILDALDTTMRTKGNSTLTDEGLKTSATGQNGDFVVLSDPSTGSLISLTIPTINLSASFSNFAVSIV